MSSSRDAATIAPFWRRGRALSTQPGLVTRIVRSAPLTLALVVALWVIATATGSVLHGPRHERFDVLLDGARSLTHLESIGLSLWWAPDLLGYLGSTVVLITLGIVAERRLGTGRYAIALVTTHVLAASTVVVLAWGTGQFYPTWARAFLTVPFGGPALGVIGAVLAASATLTTLWRRRVRVGLLTLFVAMVLFYGGGLAVLLLAAAIYGLVLGRVFRSETLQPSPVGSVHEARVLAALIVAATALGPLLAMLTPAPTGPFAKLGFLVADVHRPPPAVIAELCNRAPASVGCAMGHLELHPGVGATLMACLPALLLLLFADGLRRGRRMAWIGTLALEGVLAGVAIADFAMAMADAGPVLPIAGLTDEQPLRLLTQLILPCLVPVTAAVVVLVLGRDLFTVKAPHGAGRALVRRLAILTAGSAVVYVSLGLVVADQWETTPTAWSLLTDFPLRLAPEELTLGALAQHVPAGPAAQVLFDWIGIAFWACGAIIVLRSFRQDAAGTPAQRDRARQILIANGGSSLAWMGLWEGNSYWFSTNDSTFVAYRLVQGVALTIGDPVGPVNQRTDRVLEFAHYCESIGAVPAFYSASAGLEALCTERGWSSVQIAEETVLPLGDLAFTGKKFQDLRTTLNHAKREGLHVQWLDYPTAPLSTVLQIQAISEDWVSQQSLPEMGFTLGGIDQLDDPHVRCSVAVDDAGVVHAVASWLPIYDAGTVIGWTLDFMRKRTNGFRNATELLIARGALDFQDEGFALLSLSGAPLARAEHPDTEPLGAPAAARPEPLDRLLDQLGTRLEPVYGFRSLLRFKAKFNPQYRPMYLVYADAASLPAIGRAVARAYVPDASLSTLLHVANTIMFKHRDTPGPSTPPRSERSDGPRPPAVPVLPQPQKSADSHVSAASPSRAPSSSDR
ncbi:bifunctional lysylphosphatidylglycerol flippase/synthetase MprF [Pengzhenrongella phosphoraccumulans]|uniref:bifunctional lysylphosphatidylglycerol flippase/synthetase MprF n=1 Tax=Pengzhenrongella phosphoraccumulans TaxID=3114394 RepID=UPI00388D189F